METSNTRTERTKEKQDRVLSAAQQVFMQYGFEGASMDAIALAASVSKPTLYRYYPNKEAMFIAVLEQLALRPFSEDTLVALNDMPLDSPEALEHALNLWARTMHEHLIQPGYIGLIRLLIAELPRFPALGGMFAGAVAQQGGMSLMAMLRSAKTSGVITVEDLEPVLRLLVSCLVYYVLSGLFAPDEPHPPPHNEVAAQIHLIVRGISR
jgi:AcrR family transcriptional regulator